VHFTISRKDVAGGAIEIDKTVLSGRLDVKVAGNSVHRLKEKGAPFLIPMKDGSSKQLILKMHLLDPVPAAFLDGEEILLARKLRVIECIFAFLPIMMFMPHGPLMTLLAFFILLANFRLLRTTWMPTLRWCAIYALSISIYAAFALLLKLVLK
jgi:hypothetical protein